MNNNLPPKMAELLRKRDRLQKLADEHAEKLKSWPPPPPPKEEEGEKGESVS